MNFTHDDILIINRIFVFSKNRACLKTLHHIKIQTLEKKSK